MAVAVNGTLYNTDSGVGGLLDKITAQIDAAAQNREQLRGLAAGGVISPDAAPGPSLLSRLLGFSASGTPAPAAAPTQGAPGAAVGPAAALSAAPVQPSALPSFAAAGGLSPNAQKALAYFQGKGLSPIAAQGLVGGFTREAGPNVDPNAINSGSGASGIAQWLGSRLEGLKQFAASTGRSANDLQTQLDYVWSELSGPERKTLAALHGAQNPLQATIAALGFERPEGWTPDNPLGARDFGKRLAATVGLGRSQPDVSLAYAPAAGADQSPSQAAITRATSAPMPQATADAAQGPYGSLAGARAAFAPQTAAESSPAAPQQVADNSSPNAAIPEPAPTPAQAPAQAPAAAAPPGAMAALPSMDQIRALIQNPETRQLGLQMWQTALAPKITTLKEGEVALANGRPYFQAPGKNMQVTQIGEDQFGNKLFGTVDQRTGQITPIASPAASGSGGPGVGGVDPNLHGPDYLATLNPAIASQVKALAEGRAQFPSGMGANSPMAQRLRAAVLQYDPNFDMANANARYKTRNDFASGNAATTITAGNTAIQHLGELSDAAEKLGNTNVPIINAVKNYAFKESGGGIPLTQFNNIISKYVEEATKFYRGTGGNESDIERDIKNLSPNMSPAQLRAAIQAQIELLQGKVTALQDRWHQGMGATAGDYPIISAKSQAVLNRLAARTPDAGTAPTAAAQSPIDQARAAIARGAPRDAVLLRLQQMGIDTSGSGL